MPRGDQRNDIPYFLHEGAFADTSKAGALRDPSEGLDSLENLELVEGWFSDTLPTMQDKITKVAFVRVDCDLYMSTADMFHFLSGRLVNGAIIYFDDWTHEAGTGESKAFFEFAEREASRYTFERLLTVSDGALAIRVRRCSQAFANQIAVEEFTSDWIVSERRASGRKPDARRLDAGRLSSWEDCAVDTG